MAAIKGQLTHDRTWPETNVNLSSDLNAMGQGTFTPIPFDSMPTHQGGYSTYRIPSRGGWGIKASKAISFFDDFYNRIHVTPLDIDLETVASPQTREVKVWNAWVDKTVTLNKISISQPVGMTVDGAPRPLSMKPLYRTSYNVNVGTSGAATIDSYVGFEFPNVPDPYSVHVTGVRAIKFDLIPETPLTEEWEWLTDNIVSINGSEQRLSIRGEMPRVELRPKVIFDSEEKLRDFYATLITVFGRIWLPEFQYATDLTKETPAGSNVIYFDTSSTDIRSGEYALLRTDTDNILIQIKTLSSDGAVLMDRLKVSVPKGSIIAPGSASLISDNTKISRYSVNDAGTTSINGKMLRSRTTLIRPDSTIALEQFKGNPILTKRPLANEMVIDQFSTGQYSIDAQTGSQTVNSYWDYERVGGNRSYHVKRIKNPEEMDYWKALLSHCMGSAKQFWTSTFRNDLKLALPPSDAAASYTIYGTDYSTKIYPIPTHRFIEIETKAGIHRAKITGASTNNDTSIIVLENAVPAGYDWTIINRISYLMPVRLGSDKVEWKHNHLDSTLSLSIRTAEV